MTARQAIMLFLVGAAFGILGALFKIQHWPYAGEFLITSSALEAIAVIVLVFKVGRYPGFKDFLDQ
jgi:uncharacterized membrane protein HdeD (DUF308 family)